ncbi:hypothetical protein E4U57_006354 [Claviceps arundinis]|uniref:Uncharacterized protein n=1 Tax=Claviceps arundinis TaxID=1623583 RepID=A0ABQ7P210_9HYPO|nr:hypothetical protein E4U57_006354 [Claviceps arundinis]
MAVKPKGRADTGDARNVLKKPSQWRSDVPSIESHASGAVANGMPLLKPIDSELTELQGKAATVPGQNCIIDAQQKVRARSATARLISTLAVLRKRHQQDSYEQVAMNASGSQCTLWL